MVCILIIFIIVSCNTNTDKDKPSLRNIADKNNFFIGTAVNAPAFDKDKKYRDILKNEFNVITIENELKFIYVHPQRDKYDFQNPDLIVKFAMDNNQKVRGHTLVWHHSLPDWVNEDDYSKEELKKILKDHIQTVVSHYKGKLYAWDVVNEAFDDNGKLRDNIWLRAIGPEYIELAFRWAHEADPNALLFYNDYNNAGISNKSNAIYEAIKALKERGVPIDGVGFQSHITTTSENTRDYEAISKNMKRLSDIGVRVEITEMDVKIKEGAEYEKDELEKQAKIYSDTLAVCVSSNNCSTFVMWGFTDKYTSIPEKKPLIFDAEYRPKPAYEALYKRLLQKSE